MSSWHLSSLLPPSSSVLLLPLLLLPLPQQPVKEPIYALNERKPPRPDPVIVKRWSWSGLAIFLYFCAAAVYYFIIRATRTLNIGYTS
jgi:hypothetical protein